MEPMLEWNVEGDARAVHWQSPSGALPPKRVQATTLLELRSQMSPVTGSNVMSRHVVPIDGVTANKESILSKKYPYARPTFYYTNGEPTGEAAKFIEFTLSDAGQKIVEKIGFITLK
jgi:hypothetical protein